MRMTKRARAGLGAAVSAGCLALGLAAAPAASAAPGTFNVTVPGGFAHWVNTVTDTPVGSFTAVQGYVLDTKAGDGRCARVRAYFSNGEVREAKSCNQGRVHFTWTLRSTYANVYLSTVSV